MLSFGRFICLILILLIAIKNKFKNNNNKIIEIKSVLQMFLIKRFTFKVKTVE